MRKSLSVVRWALVMLLGGRVLSSYIDPNTGGMLFQALVALFGLLAGTLYFFSGKIKMMVGRIRRYFRGTPNGGNATDLPTNELPQEEEDETAASSGN